MSLSSLCIKRPVLTIMMNLALVLMGIISLQRLPVRELPDIDPPIISIMTVYPGANADIVETEVTEKLEDVINGVEGIRKITSESRDEVSNISVRFELARNIDLAAQDVRDRVSRVRGDLPEDIDDSVVSKQDSDAEPMIWIALFSEHYSTRELTEIADRYLKEPLQTVNGVSSVIFGGEKRLAIRLRLDPEKMSAHNLTVDDVARALKEQHVELPSGRIENRNVEFSIKTLGELKTTEEFERLVLVSQNDVLVRLSDVGLVELGIEDERGIARYNSSPAVGLGVVRQSKANTIEVAHGIKKMLAERRQLLPKGIKALVAYDKSTFIEHSIEEVWNTLFVAFALVVLTIFIFLRNPRSTLVPSLTIPVAIIAGFSVLMLMGYSINILTMLGLVLAIGLVVDDSIVVLENIYRHIENGESPMQAAYTGMKEISFAVIATTVALLAVFLPLAYQTTVAGRLFIEFAIAISGSVVISTFVALTLTPMISSRILSKDSDKEHGKLFQAFENFFIRTTERYTKGLDWALRNRKKMVTLTLLTVLGSYLLYISLNKEFLPEEDKGYFLALAIAPEGATTQYTDRMTSKMEEIVKNTPEVEGYFSAIAPAFNGPGEANRAFMFVRMKEERSKSLTDLFSGPTGFGASFFGRIEGALSFPIMPKAVSFGFGQPFQLVIQSTDLEKLDNFAQELTGLLQQGGYLQNVRSSFELNKPELQLTIQRDRAVALGVSIESISRALQILFGGLELSTVKLEGEEYNVIVQLDKENRLTPDDLSKLYLRGRGGKLIQLNSVVTYKTWSGPNKIERYSRLRSATIEGTPIGITMGEVMEKVEALLEEKLPLGFDYAWTGETEDLQDATGDTTFVILLAIVAIYMVLAAQFESLVHPFTVMLALPLGMFGGLAGLWILDKVNMLGWMMYGWANYAEDPPWIAGVLSWLIPRIPSMTVNLYSQIGMVLLFGLVTKNSILLVEFANQAREKGMNALEAIEEAGRIRLRPILMTALATIIGILPIAIGFGAGAESRRPMGVVVVAGMTVSTFLTLFVVPVFYTLLADMGEYFKRRSSK